jgi:antitoxin YefM
MRRIRFDQDIRPLSEFRSNAAAFLEHVRSTGRPIVLTQHGRSAAVLLDVAEYERLVEQAELIGDVQSAEEQIASGEGIAHLEAKRQIKARLRR